MPNALDNYDAKLYCHDSYLEIFDAAVLACEKYGDAYRVILDQTAFFPGHDNVVADTGTIDDKVIVSDVFENEGDIYHIVNEPLEVGSYVTGRINIERRIDVMRQHTGCFLSSLMARKLFEANTIKCHVDEIHAYILIDKVLDEDQLSQLEISVNELAMSNAIVETRIVEKKEGSYERVIFIGEDETMECMAPHVNVTGEVGCIKFLETKECDNNFKINLICGIRAIKYFSLLRKY